MEYNPNLHSRHSIRLRGYDYSNTGAYFVTICLNRRISAQGQQGQPRRAAPTAPTSLTAMPGTAFDFPTFGMVENGVMVLNDSGKMVQQTWNEMQANYPSIEIGEFIVMPDHIHGIIKINNPSAINGAVGAARRGCPISPPDRPISPPNHPISPPDCQVSLPNLVYYLKTRTLNKYIDGVKTSRNYWEHIIRNETEYARIAQYIRNNPISWGKKHLNVIFNICG